MQMNGKWSKSEFRERRQEKRHIENCLPAKMQIERNATFEQKMNSREK